MELNDNAVFRTQVDAGRCFGDKSNFIRTAKIEYPYIDDVDIWFPQLQHKIWGNSLSEDETIMRSRKKKPQMLKLRIILRMK